MYCQCPSCYYYSGFNPYFIPHPPVFYPPQVQLIPPSPPIPSENIQSPSLEDKCSLNDQKMTLTKQDFIKYPQTIFKDTWTQEEDEKLIDLIERKKLSWKQITGHLGNRNYKMCYNRYTRMMEDKKESWTKSQDEKIKELYLVYGKKWKKISNEIKGRTPKQVRERYVNFLRPNLNNERWSIEEDLKLVYLINTYGRRWNKIVEQMGTRSHNQIRNRFNHRIMKVWKQKCEQ